MVAGNLRQQIGTVFCCVIFIASEHAHCFSQNSKSTAPAKSASPRLNDNQRLLSQFDSQLESGSDLIGKEGASIESALLLRGISQLAPPNSDVRNMISEASTVKRLGTAADSYLNEDYLNALSSLIRAGASFAGGRPGWAAFGEDVVEKIIKLQLMSRDQVQLAEAEWKLQEASKYAHFKDPQTQADLKRMYDAMYADAAEWDRAFKAGLAQNGNTPETVAKALAVESDRKLAAKASRGLTIVDPDDGVQALKAQPCINPDFITALEKQNQALAMGNMALAGAANKYPDHTYIPIFRANCKPAASRKGLINGEGESIGADSGGEDDSIGADNGKIKIQRRKETFSGGRFVRVIFRFPSPQAERAYSGPGVDLVLYCEPLDKICGWIHGAVPLDTSTIPGNNFDVSTLPSGTTGLKLGICLGARGLVMQVGDALPGVISSKQQGNVCITSVAKGEYRKPDLTYELPIPKRPYSIYVEVSADVLR